MRAALLAALGAPARAVRRAAGSAAVALAGAAGPGAWPELPAALAAALDSGAAERVEGALDVMAWLWEEHPLVLEGEAPPGSRARASDALLPRVLAVAAAAAAPSAADPAAPDPTAAPRAAALAALNLAAGFMPAALVDRLDEYARALFAGARAPDARVRRAACAGLVQLAALAPELLEPHLPAVVEYMLASSEDSDPGVALEATEFWAAFPDSGLDPGALRPHLPALVPLLLRGMAYAEGDEEVEEAEAAEAEALAGGGPRPERDSDVRPAHLRRRGGGGGGDEDENGAEGGGGGGDEEEAAEWNLRRASAAGLDMLSGAFGDALLPALLPEVQARLGGGGGWRAREAALLALGAVAHGCAGGLAPLLPSVVAAAAPAATGDARPLVRSIACWAAARYAAPLLAAAAAGRRGELDAVVAALAAALGDRNRRVQIAACGAVAALAEEAGEALSASGAAPPLLAALAAALATYGRRAVRAAYDAAAAVAGADAAALRAPGAAEALLAPLTARLAALPDFDPDLLPLLECLAAVAAGAGPRLGAAAAPLFARCVAAAGAAAAGAAAGAVDAADAAEQTAAALDALAGVAEGLGAGVEALVAGSPLPELLAAAAAHAAPDVRQSAFALLGDLARGAAPRLRAALPALVAAALAALEPAAVTADAAAAATNAAWALGELAAGLPPGEAAPWALAASERLARVLAAPGGALPRALVENAAVALGRLAAAAPELLAPHAPAFVAVWAAALRGVRDGPEKAAAFAGLCALLRRCPAAGAGAFTPLCEAVVSWAALPADGALEAEIGALMGGYRAQLEGLGQWGAALAALSPPAAAKLQAMVPAPAAG